MTRPADMTRTEDDWTPAGRANLGHEVLDLAPAAPLHPCYTGWYARQLGVDQYRQATALRPLLDRMARHGLLAKTGGAYNCGECPRTHCGPCYYGLVVARYDAHELWADIVARPRWYRP